MVAAIGNHLTWASYPPDSGNKDAVEDWKVTVTGKGGKARVVLVPLAARALDMEDARLLITNSYIRSRKYGSS